LGWWKLAGLIPAIQRSPATDQYTTSHLEGASSFGCLTEGTTTVRLVVVPMWLG